MHLVRTDAGSSRRAASPGVLIAAVSVILTLCAGSLLAGCGGSGRPGGAPAPPRPGSATGAAGTGEAADAGAAAASGSPAAPGGPVPSASAGSGAPVPPSSPARAAQVVGAYFAEINAAARDGRVADTADTALPGCQTCALDVGMTRHLDQNGVRTATPPYEITGLAAGERRGTVVDVRFTATARPVRLLDPAGRDAGLEPGVPARAATARLVLTGPGWRIQNIVYAAGATR
ncbi:hypothetical protein [Parafrankia elaeagni]|uniref:hypothetical protein n=1 Tax=Parafrankia elaeagni TaxID=222534 RepID=UPI0003A81CCE|nr:hypothetical protein [Parafrankia elaeagni]